MKDIDPLEVLRDHNIALTYSLKKSINILREKYNECGTEEEREAYIQKLVDNAQKNARRYIS